MRGLTSALRGVSKRLADSEHTFRYSETEQFKSIKAFKKDQTNKTYRFPKLSKTLHDSFPELVEVG